MQYLILIIGAVIIAISVHDKLKKSKQYKKLINKIHRIVKDDTTPLGTKIEMTIHDYSNKHGLKNDLNL